jgi:site-specific recombinase XerD
LRRTFATLLANEGVDITKIAQMLGQAKPSSSKVYMSFNNAEISKCAMDFADIPVKGGVYHDVN